VELAITTGIPPAVWAVEDDGTIATALTVLQEQADRARRGK
jgi:hypothetical protein